MNIRIIQTEQKLWASKNFGNKPSYQSLLGVMEEAGELAHAHLKAEQQIRNQDYDAKKQDAIGDIMIYLMDYCNREGYDLQDIITQTWSEVCKRDWVKYPKNGRTE